MTRNDLLLSYIQSNQAIYKAWKQRFLDAAADVNVSSAHIGVLFSIARLQPAASVDIAKDLRITRGAVAQFIDMLQAQGLVSRQDDTRDKRVVYITLTALGQEKVHTLEVIRHDLAVRITAALSDAELTQAYTISQKILTKLES